MLTSAQEVQCIGPQGSEQCILEGYVNKVGFMVPVDHRRSRDQVCYSAHPDANKINSESKRAMHSCFEPIAINGPALEEKMKSEDKTSLSRKWFVTAVSLH